jgi:D-xylose transport system substrate-binding protein
MSNRAMKFAALGAVAAVALTGCGSSSKSGASTATSAAAAATSAAAAATSAAVAATSAAAVATSAAAAPSATTAATAAATAAATSAATASGATGGSVGVILPDTVSSTRWEDQDRPNLTAAFKAAGIKSIIQNAQNSTANFATIADSMISQKVNVLILVGLDSPSAAAVEKKAADAGIKTIDYDRLTLGGSASYYVSFDNVKVGQLQGQGLVKCLAGVTDPKIIEINGAPTDNNATLFAQGYNSVLDPLYAAKKATKVGDKSIAKWDNGVAGTTFQQLLTAAGGKVDGVLVANDGMAGSVQTVLKNAGVKAPTTGQDATVPGLQAIMSGTQCMTVFKDTSKEAAGAAALAISLIKGTTPPATTTVTDPQTKRAVPSVLLTPEAITTANIEDVIKGKGTTAALVCTAAYKALCTKYGVS